MSHYEYLRVAIEATAWLAAIDVLFAPRSSQGTIAWILSLIFFPIFTLPVYLVFGRRRFRGYRKIARRMRILQKELAEKHSWNRDEFVSAPPQEDLRLYKTLERIATTPFLADNDVALLISGENFFDSLLEEIGAAQKRVCMCFYIVRDDALGIRFKDALIAARKRGVEVRFLYDEVGSVFLSSRYVEELRAAGVTMLPFYTRRGRWNFFQLNFRNHRKIAIVDSRIAYIGGFNIGDEYHGKSQAFGTWRDTQVRIKGPAVTEIEAVFLTDWSWATQTTPAAENSDPKREGKDPVLTLAIGPIDERERGLLFFQELFASARARLWIATPYFIPDDALFQTLKLAAIRGVDVRLLIPEKSDSIVIGLAHLAYFPELMRDGVKVYSYHGGFMHQKVVLVDDRVATVGSANLDNRSLRLAFEITVAVAGPSFTGKIASMLEEDLKHCRQLESYTVDKLPILKRIGVSIARLFSPLL